jgi:dTDP-4-amino-4,6-dideoxygalactose transaminase
VSVPDGHIGVYAPLAPGTLVRRPRRDWFPLDRPGLRLTHLGRGAVWLALEALGLGRGSRVAMPAYHCGSEVEAAHLAGVDVDFYRVDGQLRVDAEDLARAAEGADAVYLVSHFGFPMADAPPGARLVIEDAAHGLCSADPAGRPLGSRGHAAVFSPRKSLGIPDGGAVVVRDGSPRAVDRRPGRRAMVRATGGHAVGRAALSRLGPVRRAAAALIDRASRTDAAAREGELTATVIGEWGLDREDMENAAGWPARLTAWTLPRVDPADVRARRRRNYAALAAELAELAPEPFRSLPEGTAPLFFPALVGDRDRAISRLLDHGVRALEVWPVPHPILDRSRHAELDPIRDGLLALPVHQSLREEHVERVLEAARAVLLR